MNLTTLIAILLAAYGLGVASLAWNLWNTIRLVREQRAAPPLQASDDFNALPRLDVLIPVKDEERNIANCIESVLAQDYPGLRIIVVNDRSTDGTVAEVERLQAKYSQVQRIDIKELPDGLYGKPHGLHQAAGLLQGDYVAFVDSDLWLRSDCLRTLVQHLVHDEKDWVATMGGPEIHLFWERLLVPILGAISFAWYDPRKISDPKWPDAIGSALMVVRRSAYEAIGGHKAVISTYDEDSELVRIAKRAGQRVSFILTPELFTQRHYGSLARTIHGLTRTLIGGIKTVPRMLLTMGSLDFISLCPFGVAAIIGVLWALGHHLPHLSWWLLLSALHAVISTWLAVIVYRTAGVSRTYGFLHPLGSAVMIYICIRAMRQLKQGGRITWRGTTYAKPTLDTPSISKPHGVA